MDIKDRLKKIDDFFDNLSTEEFDKMLENTGIYDIKASGNYNMELKLNLANTLGKNKEKLYSHEKEIHFANDDSFNLYDDNSVQAS